MDAAAGTSPLVQGIIRGFLFFGFLAWLVIIRENHIGERPKAWCRYLIVGAVMAILARITGIPLLPSFIVMVLLAEIIPSNRFYIVPLASIAYGLFIWTIAAHDPNSLENLRRQVEEKKASYFLSDAVDPTIEYDIIPDVKLGKSKFNIPVPKDYQYKLESENENGDETYAILLTDTAGNKMAVGFWWIKSDKNNFEKLKWQYNQAFRDPRYQSDFGNLFSRDTVKPKKYTRPEIIQRNAVSMLIYSDAIMIDTKEPVDNEVGLFDGYVETKNYLIQIYGLANMVDKTTSKQAFVSWIAKFLAAN